MSRKHVRRQERCRPGDGRSRLPVQGQFVQRCLTDTCMYMVRGQACAAQHAPLMQSLPSLASCSCLTLMATCSPVAMHVPRCT